MTVFAEKEITAMAKPRPGAGMGTLLAEADDEWQIHRRYFSKDSMRQLYEPELDILAEPTALTLAPVR